MTWSLGRARLVPVVLVFVVAVALAGCAKELPASVVEGSTVTVGWSGDVTSLNAATTDGATPDNREVAAMTRGQFARIADGEVQVDESFGAVEVIDDGPEAFTVRYDLADRRWSDGIPVDAADLMLAWAAGSNALTQDGFDSIPSDLTLSEDVPELDEFERRIDVAYTRPVRGWQTALDVAVPAHVVGKLALDIDDAMEAKQAVITAIQEGETEDLADIAEVWNSGFDLDDQTGDLASELLISSGPYRVDSIEQGKSATERVRFVVNREYTGEAAPAYERIELVATAAPDRLAELGVGLDVAQVVPTSENFHAIRALERRDHHVGTTHDGRLWALVLRVDRGVFSSLDARLAFLRAVPRSDLTAAGAGPWREAYASSDSLLFGPGSDGYTVSLEDVGLRKTLGAATGDAAVERQQAGVAAGTPLCVLYDKGESFAVGAFAELKSTVAEAGWRVRDCGVADVEGAVRNNKDWHAVLTTVPLPESPRDVADLWGSSGGSSLSGASSKQQDQLIADVARTPDPYLARELKVAIETVLVSEAIAVPLAIDPVVTIADRGIENVRSESGRSATLMSGASDWGPAD